MVPFTLVLAYYDNPQMLELQQRRWLALRPEIRANLHVRVVDDGSPRWPAVDVLRDLDGVIAARSLASFELYRMKVDVPWNQDACRNIGVRHAGSRWVLLTDMDHVVPAKTWECVMSDDTLEVRRVYRFGRVSAPDLAPYKYHPNTWAMTSKMYWRCGGYDERLAGNYGTDGDFLNRVRQQAESIVDLSDVVVRYPREVVPDASTTTLQRKRPEEKDNIRRLMAARSTTPGWRPLNFSFPYERVL